MKIAIFDMDGTLIDSKKDITISINFIRQKHYGLEALDEEFVVDAINRDVRNLPKLFYNTETYEKKDQLAFEKHYTHQCTQNPYLYDGVLEMLERLYTNGVKLGVATNAPTPFAKLMLSSLGVADMFGLIVGADEVKSSKPNPEMLFKILDYFHYNPQVDRAWMIGDNSKDMESAINAGVVGLFATWGFSPQSEYESTVSTPKEVLSTIL